MAMVVVRAGSGQIDHIVADENRAQHLTVIIQNLLKDYGTLVSLLNQRTHTHPVNGGEGSLRRRKECRKGNENYQKNKL